MTVEEPLPGSEASTEAPDATLAPAAEPRTCPICAETSPPNANWCEACGSDLDAAVVAPKQPCVSCAADPTDITDDGWCQLCGQKQPDPSDHVRADHGWFAVISDKGKVHRTNEDAGAVAPRERGVALVVCDGVSSTDEAHNAAQAAAATMVEAIATTAPSEARVALASGAMAAQREIVAVTPAQVDQPPSCTLVAAIVDTTADTAQLTLGWLGDSRAYWIDADGTARQLTRDHSWSVEQLDLGELEPAVIAADRRAHSITRWLGADSHDVAPEIIDEQLPLPGLLLVCSDGLWNYAPTVEEIAAIVHGEGVDETPIDKAQRLVDFANEQGGHDNITVAIADLKATSPDETPPT